ncbi:MAG: peptidylprolyl isomerase [Bacteroidaceae bacterium]|nr:peptidylprolyl isomerase [Bacteroidaceae bacterium]
MSVRILKYLLAFCCVTVEQQAIAQTNNVIDEVIWVVGDEPILKSDVEQARLEAMQSGQRIEGDPYCVIPEQLAIQKLFLHQASIDSITASEAEVQMNVDKQVDFYVQNIGSKEKVEEYFGKTMTQIREQLANMARDNNIVGQVRQNIVKDIKVTPAQVRRYFKDVPEDSLPFIPTQVEVQIIVREPRIEPQEIQRVKDELRDYTERVNTGQTPFSTLALLYSEDTESAKRRGELGFLGRGDLVPEFANVAFNLTDTKTVSKIVESEFGFHIIQLIEKRGDKINCRHILKKPKVSEEALTQCITDLDSISNEIRRGLYTFEESTSIISADKDTRNNRGLMWNPQTASARFEMKDLPPAVAKAVANLKINEISEPFVMVNNKGKEVVAIAKLKNKIPGHRATMADDYQEMQDVVLGKLYEERIEEWIREMQRSTYVRINEDWRNCEFKYPGWIK